MLKQLLLLLFCIAAQKLNLCSGTEIKSELVKCHVCKIVVQELEKEISKVDPTKRIDVGGFRFDSTSKSVPMAKSETFLTEVMENICGKMDDYVKVTYKKTGKFALIKLSIDDKMNPDLSLVDFVQDGDLNKSLEHFCLEILDDHENVFLESFQAAALNNELDIKICSELTNYCEYAPPQEDYEFDEKDEL